MLKGILKWPPPPSIRFTNDNQGKTWRVEIPHLETVNRARFFDDSRTAFNPHDLKDGERLTFSASIRLAGSERPRYGGACRRNVFLIRGVTDELQEFGWNEVFGPIRTFEAWTLCLSLGMELQGIDIKDTGPGRLNIFLHGEDDDANGLRCGRVPRCGVTLVRNDTAYVRKYLMTDVTVLAEAERIHSALHGPEDLVIDVDTLAFMLAFEYLFPTLEGNRGYSVSSIWRRDSKTMDAQARNMGMTKTQYLRTRLERRQLAANRKKSVR